MKKITFKRNWCDYLTPCPYREDTMVGEYECIKECRYCRGSQEGERPQRTALDGRKYFDVWTGEVSCAHK